MPRKRDLSGQSGLEKVLEKKYRMPPGSNSFDPDRFDTHKMADKYLKQLEEGLGPLPADTRQEIHRAYVWGYTDALLENIPMGVGRT